MVFTTAAVLGQHPLPEAAAQAVAALLHLDADVAQLLQTIPARGSIPGGIPTDPTIYRFHEMLQVYGTTLKAPVHEQFGDGIISAVNFRLDVKKVADPEGRERARRVSGRFPGSYSPRMAGFEAGFEPLAVLEALADLPTAALPAPVPPASSDWPGVDDPEELRAQLVDWLGQYANAGTRRTYAYALGLPIAWVDAIGAGLPPTTGRAVPPPARTGPLHDLAWFRWCARQALDPRDATARHVKAWLHALDAAGAQRRTRQRMLATLSALYGHLAETGVVAANPAALNRARLGLSSSARDASPTIRLTAAQLRALLDAAARLPSSRSPALARLYATRAVAVVALLTLGLRISELTGLDRDDLYRTGGEDVLRVLGKGGLHREVYLTGLARDALTAYLAERDRVGQTAVPAPRGRTAGAATPLIATRSGGRCSRFDLYTLLRRIAAAAGPALDGAADRVHPHALRHAYVTIALEQDAAIQHVQADVGHATIATTQHYDRARRTRASTAADVVAEAIQAANAPGHDDPGPPGEG